MTAFALAAIIIAILLMGDAVERDAESRLLVMGAIGLAVVSLTPAIISMRIHGGGFDLFHPLFFAAWFFFIPQFVISTFIIVFTTYESSALPLVFDAGHARLQAMALAYLGSIGLSLGYFLRIGPGLARRIPAIPTLELPPSSMRLAATIMLALGLLTQALSFRSGLLGYQFNQDASATEGIAATVALVSIVGQGVVWYAFFKVRRGWVWLAAFALALILLNAVISGSRGALFNALLIVVAGYQYAQTSGRLAKVWKWGVVAALVLLIGMIFGSFFRLNKTAELGRTSSMQLSDVAVVTRSTMSQIQSESTLDLLEFGWERIAERLDGITSLAVIAGNADRFKQAEVAFGIRDNIIRDLVVSLVPRFLWPGKPIVGGLEEIGNLYFQTLYHSPAVTYMGDLFRNFGMWGVLPGMMIIGFILRTIYAWLIERKTITPLRVGIFMMLSSLVNYESLYSVYLPGLIRALVLVAFAIMLAKIAQIVHLRRTTARTWG